MQKLTFHSILVALIGLTAPLPAQQYWVSTPALNARYNAVAIHPTTKILYLSNSTFDGIIRIIQRLSLSAGLEGFVGNENASGVADGFGKSATFSNINSLAFDSAGNLYVADFNNSDLSRSPIRKVSNDGFVSTIARVNNSWQVAADASGNVYVSNETGLQKIDSSTNVTTVPGLPSGVNGVACDEAGNIYASGNWWGRGNPWIQKISTNGGITTRNGILNIGAFTSDKSGNLYISAYTTGNYDQCYLVKIDTEGNQTTLAGGTPPENSGYSMIDGIDTNAAFASVLSIAVDDSSDTVYVIDNGQLRVIGPIDTWRTIQSGSELYITGYNGELSNAVTIPRQINGRQVTGIAAFAFAGNTKITSLTIPNGVTTIGSSAFSGCGALTSVSLPDSVINMGMNLFDGDYNLTDFHASVSLQNFLTQYASELGISPMAINNFTSSTQASLFNSIGAGLSSNTGFIGAFTGQILATSGNYGLATKTDLTPLATKNELATGIAPLATKSELAAGIAPLATKAELTAGLAPLATKTDLAALAGDTNFVASLARNPAFLNALAAQLTSSQVNYGIASKATQTISLASLTVTYSKKTKTVSLGATSSAKLTPITYTIGNRDMGSISGQVLTLTGVKGTTMITASQAGTAFVNPASVTVNLTVK